MSHKSGDFLGRYQLLCPIAAGGMATVWAARVQGAGSFQKPVALKLMLPHLARDDRFVTMFMDEAMLAANIQSPHVVGTYDLGRDDETLYMAMELVLGMTLRDLLMTLAEADKLLPVDVALSLIVQMARGLADAHEAKGATGEALSIIHRDVSPHNVLLGLDGRARLSDFGIARAVQRQSRTETGEVKGKLSYFAPEQLKADDLDQRVDVFALGIVAWEALAGRRLFEGDNPLQLAFRLANDPIPRIDSLRPEVPARVADALAHALTRDREQRCPSARAFVDALLVAAQSGSSTGLASDAAVAQVLREHAGRKVEALEKRVRELMALPTDAAPETFRAGQKPTRAAARSSSGSSPSLSATSMPGLPRETMPIAHRAPTPHYGRIAAVALLLAGLLTGGAWMTVRALSGPEPVAPVATPMVDHEVSAPVPTAAPPPTATVAVAAPPEVAPPAEAETLTAPAPSHSPRHASRPSASSARPTEEPAPTTTVPTTTVPTTTVPTAPAPHAPVAAEPEPEARPTREAPASPSIVADQNEFCRAMGTCP